MVQASLGFALMVLCMKFASRNLPSLEVVFFRSLIGSIMIYAVIRKKRVSVFGTSSRTLMIWRGLTGFIALSLHFYTIEHLPLGTAVMLNYTGPIFTVILAVLFLREKLSPLLASMILVSFLGVYLLVGADVRSLDPFMVFLGLLSAFFVGIVYVVIRAIHDRESPFTIIFYFTLVSTIGSIFYLPFGFKWPSAWDWALLLGVGIGSFYGQWLFTLSLRYAPASLVSPFAYLTPLLSFISGLIFFNEKMTVLSLLGAALIILSGCLVSYFEGRKSGEGIEPSA